MVVRLRVLLALAALALLGASCSSDEAAAPDGLPLVTTTSVPSDDGPASTGSPSSTAPETTTTTTTTTTIPVPVVLDENGFNDHSVPVIASTDEYFALAKQDVAGRSIVKFNIPDMTRSTRVHWMDSNFYALHDEWYFFRLLNGQPVPAIRIEPVAGLEFTSIAEIYDWAERRGGNLPAGLRVIDADDRNGGDRVYAPEFYRQALNVEPRNYGAGSLLHFPDSADDGGERWLIELEFSDAVTPDEVELYFERMAAALPSDIADQLEWVLRSPAHEATAATMVEGELPYHERIVRFRDLVEPGVAQVYNEGIAAGRLLIIEDGRNALTDATDESIILVENVPDYLPPAAALLSSSPQTPLAHVNILARNRGIPNASLSGLLDDPGIRQAARIRGHAIIRATEAGGIEIVLITRDEYEAWRDSQTSSPIAVPAVDPNAIDDVYDLGELARDVDSAADLDELRPIIGGKATGMITILRSPGVTAPTDPLALSVRPYLEHLAPLEDHLDAMLAERDFRTSSRARFLLLEGAEAFAQRYPDENDVEFAERFRAEHGDGTLLGDILAAGGFVEMVEDQPMPAPTLLRIERALALHFDDLADDQGLRFRSSSSVEDIEGFNGAGLYDSNTGFLRPEAQENERDQNRSIARALRRTWASYWGYEAVEERILENVDHRSGAMAVLVHPRFDDELEANNGVATFTLLPPGGADVATAAINVQLGATSVTNPDEGSSVLPEAIEATIGRDRRLRLDRVQASSLTADEVLSEAAAREVLDQLHAVASSWLDDVNRDLPAELRRTTLTIDVEFKTMADGWPSRGDGRVEPARLVIKQARSLEPSLRSMPTSVRDLPIPSDIIARAASITIADCAIEVFTDVLLAPDMGFAESPWTRQPDDCLPSLSWVSPTQTLRDRLAAGPNLALIG